MIERRYGLGWTIAKRSMTFVCGLLLLVLLSCGSDKYPAKPVEDGLVIASVTSALGGTPEETELTYTVSLWNKTAKPIIIRSVEPIIEEPLKARVIEKPPVSCNTEIKGGTVEPINGSFRFRTQGMSKEDIRELQPTVKEFILHTETKLSLQEP